MRIYTLSNLVFVLLFSSSGLAQQIHRNCKDILAYDPSATSGTYLIDPDGSGSMAPMQCRCDMTTQGGGWTLVLNYNHADGTNPDLNVRSTSLPLLSTAALGTDESGSAFWGHADVSLVNALQTGEVRFYGRTADHNRVIDFVTSHTATINYLKTGIGSMTGVSSNFTSLTGHTANIPGLADGFTGNSGDFSLTEYPFYTTDTYHWAMAPHYGRWEVDDYTVSLPATHHQVWVRPCYSINVMDEENCGPFILNGQTYSMSDTYTQNWINSMGCDSTIVLNLTVYDEPTVEVTDLNGVLTADPGFTVYEWIDCGTMTGVSGENGVTFSPSSSGSYAVMVTDQNGCSNTSECVSVTLVGVDERSGLRNVAIVPNPSFGVFSISANDLAMDEMHLTVLDIKGRVQFSSVVRPHQGELRTSIDLSNLSSGMYMLRLNSGADVSVHRLFVR